MSEMPILTPDQIRANLSKAIEFINGLNIVPEFTIEDYPIGSRYRGLCKLEVEAKKGHRFRTKRTTTNKHGRWCKPKCSTYRDDMIFVVAGDGMQRKSAWLTLGRFSIWLTYANGDCESIVKGPCNWSPPRRERQKYTITTGRYGSYDRKETKYLEPDPPELIAAWDAWWEMLAPYRKVMWERWKTTYLATKGVAA